MKSAKIKFIEVFSDGTTNLSRASLETDKQTIFYEKDTLTLVFAKKPTKVQFSQNTSPVLFKSKYKL